MGTAFADRPVTPLPAVQEDQLPDESDEAAARKSPDHLV